MEGHLNARSVYDAIDESDMSDRLKAEAKACMRDAEVLAEGIIRVVSGLSGLVRAAMPKRVIGGNARVTPRVN